MGQTQWRTITLEPGEVWNGWLAGPIVWVEGHYVRRTVPCHYILTDGKLKCPHCATHPRTDWYGYCPVYPDGGRPVVVILKEPAMVSARGIKPHDAIRVRRGKEYHASPVVEPSKWSGRYRAATPARDGAVDICDYLLRLWREPELVTLFRPDATPPPRIDPPSVTAVSLAPDAPDQGREMLARLMAAPPSPRPTDPVTLGDALPPAPSQNGKYRKKRK